MRKIYVLLIITLLDGADSKGERKVDNNVSIGPPDPQAIWPVTDYLHNNTGYAIQKNLYGVYHEVTYTSPGPEVGLAMLQFDATKNSFMTFFNDGSLNGFHAVTWIFYVKPLFQQKAVLMQYAGDGTYPGMQLRLNSDDTIHLRIFICDVLGCTKKTFKTKDTMAPPGEWTLLGITWNKLWPSPEVDIFSTSKADQFEITLQMDHLRLSGDVYFGVSMDNKDFFTGELSCFQFYNTSIIGKTQGGTPDLCDPKTYTFPEYGDPIGSIEFYNQMLPTTAGIGSTTVAEMTSITNQMTSLIETGSTAETVLVTNSTTPATPNLDTEFVFQSTTTNIVVSETNFPGPETFVPVDERVKDVCSKFLLVGKQLSLASPISSSFAGSWSSCTRLCLADVSCNYVALDTISGMCSLSTDSLTVPYPSSSVYEKSSH
ncbi:uncharacterized protein LOC130050288 isoform X2 [Ostrea edulis]|uniref:uncharacterized protein LOC130050288 isoform X2 n=1 Tax=Ostrea edulis TaxID=37623 RepID=UPI0020952C30|nr:uncharacterized protein LOC130050288 isoform X2 [Ostrea edulis]